MPELDSLRGIAILLVLLGHGLAPPRGVRLSHLSRTLSLAHEYNWVGVNLFFVLSGFLITGILVDHLGRKDYFSRFYVRRALRILPLFYATLLVLLFSGLISWRFLFLSVLFLANSAPFFGLTVQYVPLWSLAVEEHFYMLWPLIVHKLSPRSLIVLITIIVAGSPLVRSIGFVFGDYPGTFSTHYTWFNLDGLAVGALLAIWLRHPNFRRRQLSGVALPMLFIGIAAFVPFLHSSLCTAALLPSACNLAGTGLLSCMLLLGTNRWKFLVSSRVLAFLGFISYGLYLVQSLAFGVVEHLFSAQLSGLIFGGYTGTATLVRLVAGSTLAIAVAYLSRRSLEERFLRMGLNSTPFALKRTDDRAGKEMRESASACHN